MHQLSAVAVDVFTYLDYRRFLRDYYQAKKAEGRGFSYRAFSRRAGLRSPNHLKRVIDGDRSLSEQSTSQYATALGLNGEPADYFSALVRFNQSLSRRDRERAYQEMLSFRGYRRAQHIDARFAEYHAHWYVPVVRELAVADEFRADPAWVARRLRPAIRESEAAQALAILTQLGMLVDDGSGRVRQAEPVVSTGPQTTHLHIARYHRAMLGRASEAIDAIGADERYLSQLTFAVGPRGFEAVRERVQRFRSELIAVLQEAEGREPATEVLQLGIQLFPVATLDDGAP